jgi:2-keto-4-pentenoate hydratase/2-oxohepta-3-ene-1,7-dioic acid hydratase in catechol pathway
LKLVTFLTPSAIFPKIGALIDEGQSIVVLEHVAEIKGINSAPVFRDMLSFLSGADAALDVAYSLVDFAKAEGAPGMVVPFGEVSLLSPVPRPESIRDCMAFEDHIINCIRRVGLKKLAIADEYIERKLGRRWSLAYRLNKAFYKQPIYYKSNRFSVVGHGADVLIPSYTEMMDYELEFGVFLKKSGKDIPAEKARDYIGGYTIFNDFSARDMQLNEQKGRLGPAKGKDFDTGNALGPYLVTADEIKDPYSLEMTAKVNGELWSKGNSSDMYWRFEDIIAHISRSETVYPGEFIGSGTCSGKEGCGCGLEMGRFLKSGDVVELSVEKLGVLRNRVV